MLKLRHLVKEEEDHKVESLMKFFLSTGFLSHLPSNVKFLESKLRSFRGLKITIDDIERK